MDFFLTPPVDAKNRKELTYAGYYTAIFPKIDNEEKYRRDQKLTSDTLPTYQVTPKYGQFKKQETHNGKQILVEKGVDVLIATDLLSMAFNDRYDYAYVISEDTDLLPAIREIKSNFKEKKIFQICFNKLHEPSQVYDACLTHHVRHLSDWIEHPDATSDDLARLKDKFKAKRKLT